MKDVLVIIPAYNEEKSIAAVIGELRRDMPQADILVVDDCSTDNTARVLQSLEVAFLSLQFNLGYASALQTGFKYAVNHHYRYVIQFDGDGQHIAAEAVRLYEIMIREHADIVIGSRYLNRRSNVRYPLARRIGAVVFNLLIRALCKRKISDPTSGFQVISERVFSKYSKMHNYPYYPDANLIIDMLLEKHEVIEVSVEMRSREHGHSMHDGLLRPARYMVIMFYSIFIVMLRHIPGLVRSLFRPGRV